MTGLFILFLCMASILWLSIYGYLLVLGSIVLNRRKVHINLSMHPELVILVPVLNEENLILSKLENLRCIEYPRNRISIIVVDGGSIDRTKELVQKEIEQGEKIQLMCFDGSKGKADQINHALGLILQDIAVVTDVDSALEPSCVKELVSVLEHDPYTAVVGAVVRPDSSLIEERIHWWLLNYLWWLEGEVLSSASISGVCYACRREKVLPLVKEAKAEDIHLALTAASRGYRVRICRKAFATEIRVPQTVREFLQFRHRRGSVYVSELLRSLRKAHTSAGGRLARLMRLWHFLVTPMLVVCLGLLSILLLFTPYWRWPIFIFIIFVAPALGSLFTSTSLAVKKHGILKLIIAACRFSILTLYSMLSINLQPSVQGPPGGGHD